MLKTTINVASSMRVLLVEPVGGGSVSRPCDLIGIHHGQVHLTTKKRVAPGTKIVLRINELTVTGEVNYSKDKDGEFLTCVVVDRARSSPRFPVDESGSLTILSGHATLTHRCRLTDLSHSGLGLDTSVEVKIGSMICVQTSSMLAVGEVRYLRQNKGESFHVGLAVTDVLVGETTNPQRKGFRHRLAEIVLGRQIAAA